MKYKVFSSWHKKKHNLTSKLASIVIGFIIFFLIIPESITYFGAIIDKSLNLPHIKHFILSLIGLILGISGVFLIIWTGLAQLTIGKGTPLPVVPTKKLVIRGPYKYCRNPMTLGAVLGYLGLSLLKGSIAALGLTAIFFLLAVLYIKLVEEKELEARFGEDYKNYKESTPFIIPKLGGK